MKTPDQTFGPAVHFAVHRLNLTRRALGLGQGIRLS